MCKSFFVEMQSKLIRKLHIEKKEIIAYLTRNLQPFQDNDSISISSAKRTKQAKQVGFCFCNAAKFIADKLLENYVSNSHELTIVKYREKMPNVVNIISLRNKSSCFATCSEKHQMQKNHAFPFLFVLE